MHSRSAHAALLLVLVLAPTLAWGASRGRRKAASDPALAGANLNADQSKKLTALLAEFWNAEDPPGRKAVFDEIVAMGPKVVAVAHSVIDKELKEQERKYGEILAPRIRATYLKRLGAISDAQFAHILKTRNRWKDYLLHGGAHKNFRGEYLKPIWEMKEFLLLKITDIDDAEVVARRKRLVEFAGYQATCHKILKIDPDPTVGKLSPTKIEYAHLDQPPTFMDNLHHFERSLILAHTVASEGARKVLMMTDQAAREIDVQEAEFVMFANEVRMLAGSIAWRADPLGCAVERDHSTDRKEGRASGHMSSVPGKRGFTDRNRRMGAVWYGSEGAGGGRNGRSYCNALSYSGAGHGGPLYSLRRNRVGVGRRGGVYTSQYGTDKKYIHPCPATENEMWMAPGIGPKELRNPLLLNIYKAMKAEAYGIAQRLMERVTSTEGTDTISLRFFRAAIDVKIEESLANILTFERSGDVYHALVVLEENLGKFKGVVRFEERAAKISERLRTAEMRPALRAGRAYYRLYLVVKDVPRKSFDASRRALIRRLAGMARTYKDSLYGKAAADTAKRLADPKSRPSAFLAYFEERRKTAGAAPETVEPSQAETKAEATAAAPAPSQSSAAPPTKLANRKNRKPRAGALERFGDRLRKQVADATDQGREPAFYYTKMRTRVKILAMDAQGKLTIQGITIPVKTNIQWTSLLLADRTSLAVRVLRQGVPDDHATAAFYLFASGRDDPGYEHLGSAGKNPGVIEAFQ